MCDTDTLRDRVIAMLQGFVWLISNDSVRCTVYLACLIGDRGTSPPHPAITIDDRMMRLSSPGRGC